MEEKRKPNLKELLSSDKSRTVFIVVGLIAMVLIFLSGRIGGEDEVQTEEFNTQIYQQTLTDELKSMIESIEGAGKAEILLTLENSYEYIYLDDGKTLRKVNEPTVRGVVVACEGGDSAVVSAKITQLLTTVLSIPSNKVCVSKLT